MLIPLASDFNTNMKSLMYLKRVHVNFMAKKGLWRVEFRKSRSSEKVEILQVVLALRVAS